MDENITSIERLWADAYPVGVDRDIPTPISKSIQDMWIWACKRFTDRVAYSMDALNVTYGDLENHSRNFAYWLSQIIKVEPAARVAIMLPNIIQYPVALLGSLRAGAVVVNINPQYTARELTHQLKDSSAEVIVASERLRPLLLQCMGETKIKNVVLVPEYFGLDTRCHFSSINSLFSPHENGKFAWFDFNEILSLPNKDKLWKDIESSHDEVALLQYTGGTTGLSKGAMLTHGNILSNIDQAHIWFSSKISEGKEVILTALPLYHIFAFTANCLLFAKCGAKNILAPNPRDLPTLLRHFDNGEVTVFSGVNTLFNSLLQNSEFGNLNFSKLKLVIAGGAAVQNVVAQKWISATGVPITEGYGLTEASPFVSCNLPGSNFNGTIGIPIPSTLIEIRNDSGLPQAIGEEGEIYVKGPQVMKGYWQRIEETSAVLDECGWLKTGDVGFINARGMLTITDRKKDMILVSGFNVYPNEVEAIVASHPDVFESAAVGVPDLQTGEAVRVYVVKRSEVLSEEDLIAHCKTQLTAYKVPKSVFFVESLPKSSVGKILRRELRERMC